MDKNDIMWILCIVSDDGQEGFHCFQHSSRECTAGGGDVGNFLQHVTVTGVQLLYEALPDLQESYKSLPVSFLSLFSPLHSLSCEDAL